MVSFLIFLALIWLVIASIQDIKKREVPNWLSFSLIIFALSYRAFYSIINSDAWFFLYGVFGFVCFFILAYIFYYCRVFAGGDSKLLMGLGAILPFGINWYGNLLLLFGFVFVLLVIGGIYGLLYSIGLVFSNKKQFVNEFRKQFILRKSFVLIGLVFSLLSCGFVFYFQESLFSLLSIIILAAPLLFIYGRAVEESCLIKEVRGKDLTVGDWLYEEVTIKIQGKTRKIKPYWEGLSEKEISILRRYGKKIKIKQGIPFVPVFLFSLIFFILFKDSSWLWILRLQEIF